MSNTDTVKAGMAAWCSADWATLESLLTDDFLFGDPAQPLDKNGFLGFGRTMLTAFPDWSFNASGFRENGDSVYCTVHITGTHTGALSGIPDLPTVPATGKHIDLPAEEHAYTLRDGKLSRIVITAPPEGGFTAMFAQLGVPLG
jgi:predicted ester cyclase